MALNLLNNDDFCSLVANFDNENQQTFQQAIAEVNNDLLNLNQKYDATMTETKSTNPLLKLITEILKQAKKDLKGTENLSKKELEDFLDLTRQQSNNDECCSSLIKYIEYYWLEVEYIKDFYAKYSNDILCFVKKSIEPKGALLENLDLLLVSENWLTNGEVDADLRFQKLQILYYGYLTYTKQMFFILEQYIRLAERNFQQSNLSQFNLNLTFLAGSLKSFQMRLKNLCTKIQKILDDFEVENALEQATQNSFIAKFSKTLAIQAPILKRIRLPFSLEQPASMTQQPDFSESNIKTPIGAWTTGAKVCYAIQYEQNGIYTQISNWSTACLVQDKANPYLFFGKSLKNRLIYRNFGKQQPPELVKILLAENGATNFQDIERDLFNAAANFNEDLALKEFEILLANGGNNINKAATFEDGASFLHAAAKAGNVEVARKFILNNYFVDFNLLDYNGNTALHLAAKFGYSDFVKFLLAQKAYVNTRNNEGLTALEIAAMKAHLAVLEHLLKSELINLSECDVNGFSPLHHAVLGGVLVLEDLLKSTKIALNAQSKAGLTALHLSVLLNDFNSVDLLLQQNEIGVNLKTNNGDFTALHFAVMLKDLKLVELLLWQQQVNINATTVCALTALHLAVALKAEDIALLLLKNENINFNAVANGGLSALHLAAQTEQATLVEQLLKLKADINAVTDLGYTALHFAAKFNAAKALKTLLNEKADIELKTSEGLTALMLAATAKERASKILKNLLIDSEAMAAAFKSQTSTFIWLTTQNAELQVFKHFIANNESLKYQDQQDNNLLHIAVRGENLAVIAYLIETKSIDVDAQNRRGQSALHLAAKIGNLAIVEYLIDQKANIEIEDHNGKTPIFYAVIANKFEILQKFFEKEAHEVHTDLRGANILHHAANCGNLALVKYLIKEKGMDAHVRDRGGESILFYAARKNQLELIKYLIEVCEMNIRHRCHRNRTLLMAAACHDSLNVIKYLVETQKADINALDGREKCSALHFACQFDFGDTIKYLVEHGANVHAKDFNDRTAILYAAEFCSTAVLKLLIKHGANINDCNNCKISTLHYAALGGNLANVKFLIEVHNMDALILDQFGESPVFYATRLDNLDVIKYFLEVRKISPYLRTNSNRTLLHSSYYLDICKYLIEVHDLDINAMSTDHSTPLDAADHDTALYLKSLGAF